MSTFEPAILLLPCQIQGLSLLAYLDPGSGSMILQVLVVGLAGVGVLLKFAGARILDIVWPFRKQKTEPDKASALPTGTTSDDAPAVDDHR